MKELKEKYCSKCKYLSADNCNGCPIDSCELVKFLYDESLFLQCLRNNGVYHWEGCDDAIDSYDKLIGNEE